MTESRRRTTHSTATLSQVGQQESRLVQMQKRVTRSFYDDDLERADARWKGGVNHSKTVSDLAETTKAKGPKRARSPSPGP